MSMFFLIPPVLCWAWGQSPALPSARQHSAAGSLQTAWERKRCYPFCDVYGHSLPPSLFLNCVEWLIKRSLKYYEHAISQEFPICRRNWTRESRQSTAFLVPFRSGGEAWGCWSYNKITSVDLSLRKDFMLPSVPTECCCKWGRMRRSGGAVCVNKHKGAVAVLSRFAWVALHHTPVVLAAIGTHCRVSSQSMTCLLATPHRCVFCSGLSPPAPHLQLEIVWVEGLSRNYGYVNGSALHKGTHIHSLFSSK